MLKKIILPLILIMIIPISPIASAETQSTIKAFSKNTLLSTKDNVYYHHVEPTIAISGNGTIFAGWKDAYTHNGGGVRVSFAKSIDNGTTWSSPFYMPNFVKIRTGQSDPWLVWFEENETLFYTYLEYSLDDPLGEGFTQITVAKSVDYGESWNLATATYGVGFADKETMTISKDGTIYVAYDDINMTSGTTFMRLTRSDDSGITFKEISLITDSITNPDDHLAPYVVTDSKNNVYIAWMWFTHGNWGDIYVVSSLDQGVSFSSPVDINQDGQNGTFETTSDQRPKRGSIPVIKIDQNDRLYVLWAERFEPAGLWDVYLRYSDDFGLNWSTRNLVNPDLGGNQWEPDMDIDSKGRVHVVYYDDQGGDSFRPFYRVLEFPETGDPVLGEPIDISNGVPTSNTFTRPGDYFTIRIDPNDVPHVVWSDGRNSEMDIYYAHGLAYKPTTTTQDLSIDSLFIAVLILFFYQIKRGKKTKK